jgi:hypothetical protein
MFYTILRINSDYSINGNNLLVFVMERHSAFVQGRNWIYVSLQEQGSWLSYIHFLLCALIKFNFFYTYDFCWLLLFCAYVTDKEEQENT